ncbi:MAG: ABC transporter ATP-binding protein [Nitrospirae bacterium]|nr:MAG: ABC transporter ATP-binding protein [Nitrospirota bacterium]
MIPAYTVTDVTFHYGRNPLKARVPVLQDLTFQIQAGEILGVVGPNGSGKSTLLKLLARVLVPTGGRIELYGQCLMTFTQQAVARQVAYVPQEIQQIFPFTVEEMVLMGRYAHVQGGGILHWESAQDYRIVEQALKDLDITHLRHKVIGEVSGGERQRVLLARALAQQPRVLLLDEPTAFLDLQHQRDIIRILQQLNQTEGMTVVVVSHDLNLVSQFCHRLLLLYEGRMVRLENPEQVLCHHVLESVYHCPLMIDQHPGSGKPRVTVSV